MRQEEVYTKYRGPDPAGLVRTILANCRASSAIDHAYVLWRNHKPDTSARKAAFFAESLNSFCALLPWR